MQTAFGNPLDPFQSARPAAERTPVDPVLALFAEWNVINAKVNERARRGMEAQQAFADLYTGGNVVAAITDRSFDAAYDAHMAAAVGPDPGWDRLEDDLLQKIRATPATSNAGIAARIEVALAYSEFDPDSSVDFQDLPWCLILQAIKELKAGGAS